MNNLYSASVVADNISPDGVRLTTLDVTYPHCVHKDLLRHRAWSRSVMSFRAMPPEKLEGMLSDENCYVPEVFLERVVGMGGGDPLPLKVQAECRAAWLAAKNAAVVSAKYLVDKKVAKEQSNNLIQDYCWIRELITATEWDNAFALRLALKPDHRTPMARPEVFKIVRMMRDLLEVSEPASLDYGEWHLPCVTGDELAELCDLRRAAVRGDTLDSDAKDYLRQLKRGSARRCAGFSFNNSADGEALPVSVEKAGGLLENGHMSPFEHQARPIEHGEYPEATLAPNQLMVGNFRGWVQQRYEFPHQDRYDRLIAGRVAVA